MKKQPTNFYFPERKCKFRKKILGEQRDDEGDALHVRGWISKLAIVSAWSVEAVVCTWIFLFSSLDSLLLFRITVRWWKNENKKFCENAQVNDVDNVFVLVKILIRNFQVGGKEKERPTLTSHCSASKAIIWWVIERIRFIGYKINYVLLSAWITKWNSSEFTGDFIRVNSRFPNFMWTWEPQGFCGIHAPTMENLVNNFRFSSFLNANCVLLTIIPFPSLVWMIKRDLTWMMISKSLNFSWSFKYLFSF